MIKKINLSKDINRLNANVNHNEVYSHILPFDVYTILIFYFFVILQIKFNNWTIIDSNHLIKRLAFFAIKKIINNFILFVLKLIFFWKSEIKNTKEKSMIFFWKPYKNNLIKIASFNKRSEKR